MSAAAAAGTTVDSPSAEHLALTHVRTKYKDARTDPELLSRLAADLKLHHGVMALHRQQR